MSRFAWKSSDVIFELGDWDKPSQSKDLQKTSLEDQENLQPDAFSEDFYPWVDEILEKGGLAIPGDQPKGVKTVGKNIERRFYSTLREAVNDYIRSLTGAELEAEVINGMREVIEKWAQENLLAADAAFMDLFAKGFAAGAVASGVSPKLSPADLNVLNVLKDGKYRIGERIRVFRDDAVKEFADIIKESFGPGQVLDLDIMVERMNEKVPDLRFRLERVARTEVSNVSQLGRIAAWAKDEDRDNFNYFWRPFHDNRVREMKLIRESWNPVSFPEIAFLWAHNEQKLPNGKWQLGSVQCRCSVTRSPSDNPVTGNRFIGQEANFRKTLDYPLDLLGVAQPLVDIQKARVAYHEHDGWQEHPVAVKHHQEYFAQLGGVFPSQRQHYPQRSGDDSKKSVKDQLLMHPNDKVRILAQEAQNFTFSNKRGMLEVQDFLELMFKKHPSVLDADISDIQSLLSNWKDGDSAFGYAMLRVSLSYLVGNYDKELSKIISVSSLPEVGEREFKILEEEMEALRDKEFVGKQALALIPILFKSQAILQREQGPFITIYRGVRGELGEKIEAAKEGGRGIKISGDGVSSFSLDREVAEEFGDVVVTKRVPTSSVTIYFDALEAEEREEFGSFRYGGQEEVLVPSEIVSSFDKNEIITFPEISLLSKQEEGKGMLVNIEGNIDYDPLNAFWLHNSRI